MTITLNPLEPDDREQFILDNQEAFNYGALEEFGRRDDHFEEEGQIISRKTIEESIDSGEAYRIVSGDQNLGGVVIKLDGDHGDLDLMFVSPKVHSKGMTNISIKTQTVLRTEIWTSPYFALICTCACATFSHMHSI